MSNSTILDKVKLSLRLKTTHFDDEINMYISACEEDLKASGVEEVNTSNPLVQNAITMYVKAFFLNENTETYRCAYESLRVKLAIATFEESEVSSSENE